MDGFGGHFVGEEIANKRLLSYEGKNAHNHHIWKWQCLSCGESFGPSSFSHLKRSAKCIKCNVGKNSGRWKGYEELTGIFLNSYEYNAKKRGLVWNVTPEYLWKLWLAQDGKCAYTGRKLTHGIDSSLDRIDNSFGYVEGNIQWVHRDINRMKSDFNEREFLLMCKEVTQNSIKN